MRKWIFCVLLFLSSLSLGATPARAAIDYGIDRLSEASVSRLLEGKNLAVLTHAAGRNKAGAHLIDLLFKEYRLKRIFAPEHGLRTAADDTVEDGVDPATKLPIISLYKRDSHAPTPENLAGIDAVVVDLQDVGLRYYTYIATIAEVMKAAAPLKIEIIILDRPNLLGGKIIEGKTLEAALAESFTAYHTIPTRHGMTLGELALLINAEKKWGGQITVVPATGWTRENLLASTDRKWIPPSPALMAPKQVGLYAIWGTLEDFNLAVGRGITNEKAFSVLGAPWITPAESKTLATELNRMAFPNLSFTPYSWRVTRSNYEGKTANGVRVKWTGGEVRTDEVTYRVASLLIRMFPTRLSIAKMDPRGYGSRSFVEAVKKGTPWATFRKVIDPEVAAFEKRRAPYLIY